MNSKKVKKVYMVYEVKDTDAMVHGTVIDAVTEGTQILPPKHTVRMFPSTTRKEAEALSAAIVTGIVSKHGTTIMSSDKYHD